MMELRGFVRADGRVGFRNRVLVVPLTGCESEIARRMADGHPAATCFAHSHGCDFQGGDADLLATTLEHAATHPNVGGVLFVLMGCAATLRFKLPIKAQQAGRLVKTINPQQVGGTTKVVEAGRAIVREMAEQLASVERTIVPFSALTIGTKCGASDPNSLQYCHPVVGRACDLLVEKGATVVLSEDCELIEGAGVMAKRAASPEIAAQIRAMARDVNRAWKKRFGFTLKERVVQGGMSAADWKKTSLAHAAKAGTGPITGFFDMSEIVKGPGLVILNAPNTDLECVTCLAASGCNITLFTTGRGTPVGSPIASTIKVTATRKTFETMGENIDVSVHGVADGSETLDAAAQRVVQEVLDVANGKATKAEILRHWEIAIPIRGVTF